MNTVRDTDYKNKAPLAFWMEKCLRSTPLKNEKKIMKCNQNKRSTRMLHTNINALSLLVSDKKIFHVFPNIGLC